MDKIRINVGGQVFVTTKDTISRFPNTKLSRTIKRESGSEISSDKELYFDKNPLIFQCILDYYRSGRLHINSNFCAEYVKEELEYWDISPTLLSPCCWKHLFYADDDKENFRIVENNFITEDNEVTEKKSKTSRLKKQIWKFIENPMISRKATMFQVVYLALVFFGIFSCSIHCFMLQHSSQFASDPPGNQTTEEINDMKKVDNVIELMLVFSYVCNTVFTVETVLRIVTCPSKKDFFKSLLNLIDVVGVLAYMIYSALSLWNDLTAELQRVFALSATLMIFQGFRFYRMERLCERLRLVLLSLNQSKKMLCLLTTILLITAFIFGTLIHVFEVNGNSEFDDPITCFYWAIITMTTVGYGDIRPKSIGGKVTAAICATIGLLLLSMPIAIVANDFSDLFRRYKERKNYEKQFSPKKRKVIVAWKGTPVCPDN